MLLPGAEGRTRTQGRLSPDPQEGDEVRRQGGTRWGAGGGDQERVTLAEGTQTAGRCRKPWGGLATDHRPLQPPNLRPEAEDRAPGRCRSKL